MLSNDDKLTYIFYLSIFISILLTVIVLFVVYNIDTIKGVYTQFKSLMDSVSEGFLSTLTNEGGDSLANLMNLMK